MAKLRKWCAYRTIERPYTRFSKYKKKSFVKARPGKKVIKFDMGDLKGGEFQFPITLKLISKQISLIRSNAIEAARLVALRKLENSLGRLGFYFRIQMYPHHAIRENPLAAGAGADRLSTGMKHSFGKIIAVAARVEKGQSIMEISLPLESEAIARDALKATSKKLPIKTSIETVNRKIVELTEEEVLKHHLEEAKIMLEDANLKLKVASKNVETAKTAEEKKRAETALQEAKEKIASISKLVDTERKKIEEYKEKHSTQKK